nr:lipocalin family protein [uncultured Desulfobulbus sp.]
MKKLLSLLLLLLIGCVRIPEQIQPVEKFDLSRYLGTWYEIARLDHSFERGLCNVSATYSLRADGGVRVINRGFSEAAKAWKKAEGRAYFVKRTDQGFLKVSFFGPFYGAYVVFELDHAHYRHALVCGPDRSYLWILSRSPSLPEKLLQQLLNKAKSAGFDTEKLIFVAHEEDGAQGAVNKGQEILGQRPRRG